MSTRLYTIKCLSRGGEGEAGIQEGRVDAQGSDQGKSNAFLPKD